MEENCPACGGNGEDPASYPSSSFMEYIECRACKGTGQHIPVKKTAEEILTELRALIQKKGNDTLAEEVIEFWSEISNIIGE